MVRSAHRPDLRAARALALGLVTLAAGCGDILHSTSWATRCDGDPGAEGCEPGDGGEGAAAATGEGGAGASGAGSPAGSGAAAASSSGAATGGDCVASPEACNGDDDDCDGQIDEDLGSTTCGMGPCQVTSPNCAGGAPQPCIPAPPQAESCNFADDDCDGPCDEEAGCRLGVHRSYHPVTGEHFYSTDINEAQCCGFGLEFANFFYLYGVQLAGLDPLYRCNLPNGKHLLTKSSDCEGGGSLEGAMGYAAAAPAACGGDAPLFRLYLPTTGDHFFTVSAAEHDSAVAGGYIDEGVTGYVWTSP